MPPKKKGADVREEVREGEVERVEEESSEVYSGRSPSHSTSTASSYSSGGSVTSEQLERILESNQRESAKILESNQKSMAALIASLSPASASGGSRPARSVQIKPPKWTDDETPYEYFGKYEKAMLHTGVEKSA